MGTLSGHTPASTFLDLVQLGNAGVGIGASLSQVQDGGGNAVGMWLSSTQIGIGGTGGGDVGMKRVAAKVAAMTDGGGTNLAWLQEAGYSALAAPYTNATNVLSATNLSFPVISGRSYQISGIITIANSTATEGAIITFDGGAITATTFFVACTVVGTVVTPVNTSVTLAGQLSYQTVTGTVYLQLMGYLKPASTGTFIMRASEVSHATGTLTIGAGSWLSLTDAVAL